MNDINWRDINEDHHIFLKDLKHKRVILETDVAFRIDFASNVDPYNNVLLTCEETVLRYAFLGNNRTSR